MDWHLAPDDTEVRDWAAGLLDRGDPIARVRAVEAAGAAYDRDWYAELGSAGLFAFGAEAADDLQWSLVAQELGRRLVLTPLFESVAAARLLTAATGSHPLVAELLEGRAVALAPTVAALGGPLHLDASGRLAGTVRFASPWAAQADWCLLPVALGDGPEAGADAAVLVPSSALMVRPCGSLLDTMPDHDVTVDAGFDAAAALVRPPGGAAALAGARSAFDIAMAAFCLGGAQRSLALAVEYSKERHQFGVPIGSFQAQQHKMSDVHLGCARGDLLVRAAALAPRDAAGLGRRAAALWETAATFTRASLIASLVHGGYGFTTEFDIQLYFKRARLVHELFGRPPAGDEPVLGLDAPWMRVDTTTLV